MFVFISHLSVPEPDRPALERAFRDRSRLVEQCPGFLHLQLMRPQSGPASHAFLTCWRDREAFRAYMTSWQRARSHEREPADIMERCQVRHEAYEVIMDSRLTPEWLA